MKRELKPVCRAIHPGKILKAHLGELGISINQLGRDLRVPVNRLSPIVNGRRGITADIALRLARYFSHTELNWSPYLWMSLQLSYDLEVARRAKLLEILRDVRPTLDYATS